MYVQERESSCICEYEIRVCINIHCVTVSLIVLMSSAYLQMSNNTSTSHFVLSLCCAVSLTIAWSERQHYYTSRAARLDTYRAGGFNNNIILYIRKIWRCLNLAILPPAGPFRILAKFLIWRCHSTYGWHSVHALHINTVGGAYTD